MKKIFAFLFVLALLVSVCACTKQEPAETVPEQVVDATQPSQNDPMPTEPETVEPKWVWTWDGVVAPNGKTFTSPGYAYLVTEYDGRALWIVSGTDLWLSDQETGFTKLSDQVVNYTVAYDTIYWFNLDREVWAVDWYTSDEAYLFCEDAIAVSPFTDEAEGAVVTPERANWDSYGLPIYSPYGK